MSRNKIEGVLIGRYNEAYKRSGRCGIRTPLKTLISIGDSQSRRWRKHWRMEELKYKREQQ